MDAGVTGGATATEIGIRDFLPFSILGVALSFIWFRRWRLLLFAVTYFLAWAFLGSQQMRFLSAAVALFAITSAGVLAAGAARLRGAARTAFTFLMLALAVGVGWYFNFPLVYGGTQGLAYYALGSADQYLLGAAPHYPAAKFINENLPPDAVVLMVFDARPYYVERRVVYDSFDEASETLLHVQRLNDAGEVAAYVRSLGATHILIGTATPAQYWKYYASSTRTLWESYLRGYADVIMTFPAYELREIRTQ